MGIEALCQLDPDTFETCQKAIRDEDCRRRARHAVMENARTKKAVEKALKEKDNTNGALYFMYRAGSDSSNVSWFDRELTKICEYGCHEFFR